MSKSSTLKDWLIAFVFAISFLILAGWMGADQAEDQAMSAQVLDDIKKANAHVMLNPPAEMAELDMRARYMTNYEQIHLAERK